MRYSLQTATSVDVAFLAALIDEDQERRAADGENPPLDRLLRTCAISTQVWAARDGDGTPAALWGVTPLPDDPEVGHLWMLACEEFDTRPAELESLSRLVLSEMLTQYPRLENYVDARKVRAIELLRSIGFTVEPAKVCSDDDTDFHCAWIDSDRLHLPGSRSYLPN